jgi:hypothetical protein
MKWVETPGVEDGRDTTRQRVDAGGTVGGRARAAKPRDATHDDAVARLATAIEQALEEGDIQLAKRLTRLLRRSP